MCRSITPFIGVLVYLETGYGREARPGPAGDSLAPTGNEAGRLNLIGGFLE